MPREFGPLNPIPKFVMNHYQAHIYDTKGGGLVQCQPYLAEFLKANMNVAQDERLKAERLTTRAATNAAIDAEAGHLRATCPPSTASLQPEGIGAKGEWNPKVDDTKWQVHMLP